MATPFDGLLLHDDASFQPEREEPLAFSPSELDSEAAHVLIARITEVLDNRSSAYVERLHAESLHLKFAVDLAQSEAEAGRSELERQQEAHTAVRSELRDALERAETAELKLDAYERSRADVEADIQAQLGRMSAVHEVELNGQQVNRLQAEVQHLTLQAMLAGEKTESAEREAAQHKCEAAQHKAFRGLVAAVAQEKHAQHEAARRELEEARIQRETAQLQAQAELTAAHKLAQADMAHLTAKHTAHVEQLTADLHAAAHAIETHSTTLEDMQKRHAEAQDEAAAKQAQHAVQAMALQETLAAEHNEVAKRRRQDEEMFESQLSAAAAIHQEEMAAALSSTEDAHARAWAANVGALEAGRVEAMEALRAAHSAELAEAHTVHGEQYEELQEAKASLTADNIVVREQLRALQELHNAEIARAEMLSVGHAERLSRENEAASWQINQMAEAHAEQMVAKDTALRKAQSDYSTAVRELEAAKSEVESVNKLMKTILPDGEDFDSTEVAGKHYEDLKLAYDELSLKFAQLQESAAEEARMQDEDKVMLAHQSQLILRLQEQNEKHEADLSSANTEMERLQIGLAAALVDKDIHEHASVEHSREIENKHARIRDMELALFRLQTENDSLRSQLTEALQKASDKQPPASIAPVAGGVCISLTQRRTGFGMEVSDSLHVKRLTVGGSAQQAGVPVPSKIVEVAGQKVSTKRQLAQVLTTKLEGTSSPSLTKLPFVFVTSLAGDEVVPLSTASGREEALRNLSQPLVDEVVLLQEMHSKELAERDDQAVAETEALRQACARLESERSDMEAQHCEEIMILKQESERSLEEARQRARAAKDSALRNIEETKAVEVASAQRNLQAAQLSLGESEERLRRLQVKHETLEEEMLAMSAHAAIEATQLVEANEEIGRKLDTEMQRHAAAELSLKQSHSTALAQHTERLRLLQVGYDQLDEDFLEASQSMQDAVEEVAQLKTKLAASLRQTKEMERKVTREQTARGRAESVRMEMQRSLEESVRRSGLVEDQLAIERASVRLDIFELH
eukprot:COSAG02_NODE_4891_length_4859_cov_3.712605_2_plen_1035_part_00